MLEVAQKVQVIIMIDLSRNTNIKGEKNCLFSRSFSYLQTNLALAQTTAKQAKNNEIGKSERIKIALFVQLFKGRIFTRKIKCHDYIEHLL